MLFRKRRRPQCRGCRASARRGRRSRWVKVIWNLRYPRQDQTCGLRRLNNSKRVLNWTFAEKLGVGPKILGDSGHADQ
jgi:hypothetical protein